MGLIEQARKDLQQITSNLDEFGVSVSFAAPTLETAEIVCLAIKHHLDFNNEGISVSTKTARVSFSEKLLTDLGYPTRNAKGEVNLAGHTVTWADSTGTDKKYVIGEWFADETLGFIFCKLKDYRNG